MISRSPRTCRASRQRAKSIWRRTGVFAAAISGAATFVSCAASTPSADPDPVAIAGGRAKTIAVAPLNLVVRLPSKLEPSTGIVVQALTDRLEASGKTILPIGLREAGALWLESTKATRASGEDETFENAARVFTKKLSNEFDFDALLIASLYIQNARVKDDVAYWDRANQKIEYVGRSKWEVEAPPLPTIEAASILVHVFDPDGEPIHTRRTGLELIQHQAILLERRQGHDKRTWVSEDDDPPIESEIRVRAAIAHSLTPFVPE